MGASSEFADVGTLKIRTASIPHPRLAAERREIPGLRQQPPPADAPIEFKTEVDGASYFLLPPWADESRIRRTNIEESPLLACRGDSHHISTKADVVEWSYLRVPAGRAGVERV